MPIIKMCSKATSVKGQGVSSAYLEQVKLVEEGLKEVFEVVINKSCNQDITHYHTINPEYYLSINSAKKKGAVVGYVHFLPDTIDNSLKLPKLIKKVFYKYIIKFYDKMDYLVTVNPYFINELAKYGIDKEKVTYIPNFVSTDNFYRYNDEKRVTARRKYGIEDKDFVVLGAGQVQTRKGVMDFVKTAVDIPDVTFLWAGGFSFGAITDGYEELKAVMKNPPKNVKFLGIIDREEMNEIYNVCDVFFLPSYNELFPMTVLEAMNCRVPILLRDLDIYKEILKDFYLKSGDNEEFKNTIIHLRGDKKFYSYWSDQSYKGHLFYSKDNVLSMWKGFYTDIYNKKCLRK